MYMYTLSRIVATKSLWVELRLVSIDYGLTFMHFGLLITETDSFTRDEPGLNTPNTPKILSGPLP